METCMTLTEIDKAMGVTRRAVQGYEKAGLVTRCGRNKYGHLLYDVTAQNRIARIKFYQELGFSLKEIKELIDAPIPQVKAALQTRILCLKEEKQNMDRLIEKAYELIRSL